MMCIILFAQSLFRYLKKQSRMCLHEKTPADRNGTIFIVIKQLKTADVHYWN